MKIGILTMHRVIHFGSVLQAYALQKALYQLGYESEIIDYQYPNSYHLPRASKSIKSIVYDFIYNIFKGKNKEENKISQFIKLGLKKSRRLLNSPAALAKKCPVYDVYMTGSDQVWNTDYLKGDTSFFFSFLPQGCKKVSYAASFGKFSYEGEKARQWLKHLDSYSSISVRENKAAEIIKEYSGKDVEVVLDPTLLLSKEEWERFGGKHRVIEGDYILVYILTYAWQPFPYALDIVKYYEETLGMKVVVIEPLSLKVDNPEWIYLENLSPGEFVNVFKNANLIITTSFHGTAFSINLQRPFISIIPEKTSNDDRILSLCNNVGLSENLLRAGEKPDKYINTNFSDSQKKLERMRCASLSFLKNSVN